MSTLTGEDHSRIILSEDDLARYFEAFAKPADRMRVGIEAEFFGVRLPSGAALPYFGPGGIQEILKAMSEVHGYRPVLEAGNIIALQRDNTHITLEPGGQVELSAEPVWNIFEIQDQIKKFLTELLSLDSRFPQTGWIAAGIHPVSRLEDMPMVPKARYAIMWDYFKAHGTLSHWMMKLTATNQINFDYLSEQHAMESLRVSLSITSIVTAMFANSSFSGGGPNGFICRRLDIWNHTAPERSGLIAAFTRQGCTFQDYLDYLFDMPVIFIVRTGKWVPIMKMTFRDFIRKGFENHRVTVGDFELHLSSAFPEVRLKQYLEIRGVDCQSPRLISSVAAFWKGILYDADTRRQALKLVSFAGEEDFRALHFDVPKLGLGAKLAGKPILPIARELVDLACSSLSRQISERETRSECLFLEQLRNEISRPGKSPAEKAIALWEPEFKKEITRLVDYLRIKPENL